MGQSETQVVFNLSADCERCQIAPCFSCLIPLKTCHSPHPFVLVLSHVSTDEGTDADVDIFNGKTVKGKIRENRQFAAKL